MRYAILTIFSSTVFFLPILAEAKTCAGIEVTATALNVRTGPGTQNSKVGVIHSGERYTTVATSGNWKQIWFNNQARWIYASTYTRAINMECGQVTASALNVRSGPSTGTRRYGPDNWLTFLAPQNMK